MSTSTTAVRAMAPLPESVILSKRIITARLQVARAASDLEHATIEHAAAAESLANLEAERAKLVTP